MLHQALFLALCAVAALASNEKGAKFLEWNKSQPNINVLPSGLQYEILTEGTGIFHPTATSKCKIDYSGKLIDGTRLDSSWERGTSVTIIPSEGIAGWTEALQLMVEGDKWRVFIPSELAYGEEGSGPVPANEVVIYKIELHSIRGEDKIKTTKYATCNPITQQKCSEAELQYIEQVQGYSLAQLNSESEDLSKQTLQHEGKPLFDLSPQELAWVRRRVHIADSLIAAAKTGTASKSAGAAKTKTKTEKQEL